MLQRRISRARTGRKPRSARSAGKSGAPYHPASRSRSRSSARPRAKRPRGDGAEDNQNLLTIIDQMDLRVGCDYKVVLPLGPDRGKSFRPVGLSLRTAARLERLGLRNSAIMTREFLAALQSMNARIEYGDLLELGVDGVEQRAGLFNIAKPDQGDPDTWKQLFYTHIG